MLVEVALAAKARISQRPAAARDHSIARSGNRYEL
jgi:hypothetical protein